MTGNKLMMTKQSRAGQQCQRGFTLIEILVVKQVH